jgi:hypothetical protein
MLDLYISSGALAAHALSWSLLVQSRGSVSTLFSPHSKIVLSWDCIRDEHHKINTQNLLIVACRSCAALYFRGAKQFVSCSQIIPSINIVLVSHRRFLRSICTLLADRQFNVRPTWPFATE